MFELYKWLAYDIVKPYKKFQHFIKWFAILFSSTKTNSRRKQKEKGKRKLTWPFRPNSSPPWPKPTPAVSSSSSRGTHCCVLAMPRPPMCPGHLLLPPVHVAAPGDAQIYPGSIPPVQSFF